MKGIKNIAVETVTAGFIEDCVIIYDKTINYIGSLSDAPDFAEEIEWTDGNGQIVFPGFIDVHTHLGIDEEGVGKEGDDFNETSNPITPHLRAIDGINSFDSGYYRALKAGITTVQVLPGSANVIGGLTAIIKVKPDRPIEQQCIKSPAALKIAFGENPKRFHANNGVVTRMGVAAKIREAFWRAKNCPPQSLAEQALADVFADDLPVRAHAHRADDILTAIRIADEFGFALSIEHATDGIRIVDQIKASGYNVVVGPTATGKSKVELANQSWDTYQAFERAGIPFAITTDHPVIPIEELLTAVRHAIAHGLSEEAALKSITIQAAKHLGIDDCVGSIEVGKDADFVLWSASPFDNFRAKATTVIIDGETIQ
ncbi:amidohydrolase [Aquibacillus salsiterrae]|uniref:Amidohydrolase n=1 Tax=Aquibacillus salsiterrae TaxID=2950439 RepID=A0A9X3WE97_9BACI|nr:amidohydrolase [Aquibacillus salsiterrae]MDC3415829.1 amidohydrolase [Aquibacillus salsiterrae]